MRTTAITDADAEKISRNKMEIASVAGEAGMNDKSPIAGQTALSDSGVMTKGGINWLDDPKTELRSHPDGTLIIMLHRGGKLELGYLSENQPDGFTWRFRRYPTEQFTTIESMISRGAKFALV